MKCNRVQLCGSISSKFVLTRMHYAHGAGSSKGTTEFVNHGLLLWNQGRRKWIGHRKAARRSQLFRMPKLRTSSLPLTKKLWLCCSSPPNNGLLRSSKPFPKPIPLNEMVDFLVDIWEQEEMYD